MLYMYANVYALVKVYRDSQILRDHGDVDRFISGFNSSYPLFNVVDAGNAPGSVNRKVCESLKFHINNVHCRLVVLGKWLFARIFLLLSNVKSLEKIPEPLVSTLNNVPRYYLFTALLTIGMTR